MTTQTIDFEEEKKISSKTVRFEINLGVDDEEEFKLIQEIEKAIDSAMMSATIGGIGSRTTTKGGEFCRISYQIAKFKAPNKTKEELDANDSSGSSEE